MRAVTKALPSGRSSFKTADIHSCAFRTRSGLYENSCLVLISSSKLVTSGQHAPEASFGLLSKAVVKSAFGAGAVDGGGGCPAGDADLHLEGDGSLAGLLEDCCVHSLPFLVVSTGGFASADCEHKVPLFLSASIRRQLRLAMTAGMSCIGG